jgi:hypothetical protein
VLNAEPVLSDADRELLRNAREIEFKMAVSMIEPVF